MMTLAQCTIEFPNGAVSDTTGAHSSNAAKCIIILLYFKELLQMQKIKLHYKLTRETNLKTFNVLFSSFN